MLRRPLVLLLAPVAVVAAACAADGPDTAPATTASGPIAGDGTTVPGSAPVRAAPDTTAAPPTTAPVTTAPQALVQVAVAPGSATDGFVGGGQDVTGDTCVAADGVWTAAGTLTNPTGGTVGYRVYVAYLDTDGATLALIEAPIDDVDAGATTQYLTEFRSTEPDLQCVLRVERVSR